MIVARIAKMVWLFDVNRSSCHYINYYYYLRYNTLNAKFISDLMCPENLNSVETSFIMTIDFNFSQS